MLACASPLCFSLALAAAADWRPQVAADAQGACFQVQQVAADLQQPSAMVFLPDGRGLLAERRSARIDILDPGSGSLTPVEGGFVAVVGRESGAHDPRRPAAVAFEDAGVHDLALHPNFARNGWMYVSYSSGELERSTTALDRFRLSGRRMVDRERIFTAEAYSEDRFHYGGRLAFVGPYLFMTIGDRHHQHRAQSLESDAGKIVRLFDDGRIPPDNPFVGRKEALPEIWTYGHRNPQGLFVHPETGELWEHEHGPLGGDELNLIQRGANYGWPVISYGWEYSGGPIGKGITKEEGMQQPLWVWTPAIAPSGMFVYTGDGFPAWRGSFFIGSMAQRHLNRLVVREGHVLLEERLLYGSAGRVRLVAQGPGGSIYIGNDAGQLLRLTPCDRR